MTNVTAEPPFVPAGALYFHLQDPKLKYTPELEPALERLKAFKYLGFLVAEHGDELAAVDRTISPESGGRSEIAPLGFKKDGSFNQNKSNVLTPEGILHLSLSNMASLPRLSVAATIKVLCCLTLQPVLIITITSLS